MIDPVARLAAELARLPGVVAVALGGSRATGTERPDSDWDLGVYYRSSERALDPADVRALGHDGVVSDLGEWGPVVNGGAWLAIDGAAIDVLFRDLDVVERWTADARAGRFEVLAQNGYLAGAPTYLPMGELALCRRLGGALPEVSSFPEALAAAAPPRWEGRASVALMFARIHAGTGEATPCAGMLSLATLCAAHARLAARREWALNEKRLVDRAGLDGTHDVLADLRDLPGAVDAVAALTGIAPLSAR